MREGISFIVPHLNDLSGLENKNFFVDPISCPTLISSLRYNAVLPSCISNYRYAIPLTTLFVRQYARSNKFSRLKIELLKCFNI